MDFDNEPQVSVIMNGHNAEEYLREAIDSVLAQSYKQWEIIFWDNCSTDDTANIVKSYNDSRIKYYYSDEFMNLPQARNCALEKVNCEFIAFLDCDDIWLPRKLEKQMPLFADNEVGLVYSDAIYFNSTKEVQLFKLSKPCDGWCSTKLLLNYGIAMQTVVIRQKVLNNLEHWFDPRFNAILDCDLFVRISESWKLSYVDEPLCKWRVHSASYTSNNASDFVEEKKLMLQKLEESSSFSKDVLRAAKNINMVQEAKFYWSKGKSMEARNILLSLKTKTFKIAIIWLLSFLPFKLVDDFYCRLKGTVRPV